MSCSIIIPHHNSSELLNRLLDTIPIGLYQVIVVDDNSTEEEWLAISNLQPLYNFLLLKNQFKTAGGARNTGLLHAVGEWIIFADSDDYFESSASSLIEKYQYSDNDIVFFNVTSRYSDSGDFAYRHEHIRAIAQKAHNSKDNDYLKCCYTVPWGKMIKRKLIQENQIRFDEVVAGNDMWFSVTSGLKAKKVTYEETPLYCVTVTPNSLTTTLSKDRFESRLLVTLRVNNLLRKNKKSKYQISVLYFIAKANQFGFPYFLHVLSLCIKNKSNPFIGLKKLLHFDRVLKDRQNIKLR